MASTQLSVHAFASSVEERRAGAVGELAAYISRACFEPGETMGRQIKDALARAVQQPALLNIEQRQPRVDNYARHVLYADPAGRFTILSIVWGQQQFSVPHAHHTWCAYAVYDGDLSETLFSWNADASRADPLRTEMRKTGYSCYAEAGLERIHRLGNAGSRPAISIHVYGVERERIATHVNRPVEAAQ